jgi:hypothetical protein
MPYMKCPSCGLSIYLRAAFLTVDRCPRCLAHRRMAVRMSASDSRSWPVTEAKPASIESRTRARRLDEASESPDAVDVAAHKFEMPIVKELSPKAEGPGPERRRSTSTQPDASLSDTSTEACRSASSDPPPPHS